MQKHPDGNIARAVSFEVGALDGELNAIILRIEHVPLTDTATSDKPAVSVFVLNKEQAADLNRQVLEALGWLDSNSPRVAH